LFSQAKRAECNRKGRDPRSQPQACPQLFTPVGSTGSRKAHRLCFWPSPSLAINPLGEPANLLGLCSLTCEMGQNLPYYPGLMEQMKGMCEHISR